MRFFRSSKLLAVALWACLAGATPSALAGPLSMTNLNPASKPGSRTGVAMTVQPGSPERIWIFGGNFLSINSELWVYDVAANNWSQPSDTNVPGARGWARMGFEENQSRLVLFGGVASLGGTMYGDVTLYDPSTSAWSNPTVSGSAPTPRDGPLLEWIPHLGKFFLYGGNTDTDGQEKPLAVDNGMWLLSVDAAANTATWEAIAPGPTLPTGAGRSATCSGYDPVRRRIILFGGETVGTTLGDTWQYDVDTNTWSQDNPSGTTPAARGSAICSFDRRTGQLVLYGGTLVLNGSPQADAYSYDPVAQIWASHSPSPSPGARSSAGSAYSPALGGMFFFGGRQSFPVQESWKVISNTPPVAQVSPDQNVNEGQLVTLDSSGSSDADGDPLARAWSQTAGPTVNLSSSSAVAPSFTAPSVTSPTPLNFSVALSDGVVSRSAATQVTVYPSSIPVLPDGGVPGGGGITDRLTYQVHCASVGTSPWPLFPLLSLAGRIRRRRS